MREYMGKFVYSDTVKVEIEDRALAHLHVVIGTKLRRGEPFYFSWRDDSFIKPCPSCSSSTGAVGPR
jgi:hypothetical protein